MISLARQRMRARPGTPGFSLVELMIALVAGLIVSIAVIAFLLSSFKSNGEYVQSTKLTQELRSTLDLITRDLRRAGYDEKAMAYLATSTGSRFHRIRMCDASDVCGSAATPPITCVIYGYDKAGGALGAGQVDLETGEVRGIRRKQRNVNGRSVGVVEYAASTGTKRPLCNEDGPDYDTPPVVCNATTTWCPLSDGDQLDITTLTFADIGATTGGVQLRDINIVLQGRIAGTTEYIRGLKSSVRVRSDCYDTTISNCNLSP